MCLSSIQCGMNTGRDPDFRATEPSNTESKDEISPESAALIEAAAELAAEADRLDFTTPKIHSIYNPLDYAWNAHRSYLSRYGGGRKRVLFVGMNPGPWGMAQTGVPFGEVEAVKNWLEIDAVVEKPPREHPKRPIHGLGCRKSEVSGRRLWGLMRERFVYPDAFFRDHFTENYCPLVFMEESGKNLTPDKLCKEDREALFTVCDTHIRRVVETLSPDFLIGIGKFAEKRMQPLFEHFSHLEILSIPHPSPANPQANRGWAKLAIEKLASAGVWEL